LHSMPGAPPIAQMTPPTTMDNFDSGPAFARVLFLNLQRSPERRAYATRMLRRAALACPVERWGAVDGHALTDEDMVQARANWPMMASMMNDHDFRGTVACRDSHVSVRRHLRETGASGERYLVVEDDTELPSRFEAVARDLIRTAPADWDYLRLGCWNNFRVVNPTVWTNITAQCRGAPFPVIQTQRRPACRPTRGLACGYAGGSHATIYRFDNLDSLERRIGKTILYADSALAMPEDAALRSYCLEIPTVKQADDLPSDRCVNGAFGSCWPHERDLTMGGVLEDARASGASNLTLI